MPLILVAGTEPGAGATTLAVGLAHRIAYAGHAVTLVRLAGDPRAEGDAHLFATLDIAEASGQPVAESALAALTGIVVAEAPSDVDAAALASRLGASGAERARAEFSVARMAERTLAVYHSV